ncbi:hypothetical protein AOC36_08825 [Erysipelothrix larvae]|uniref:Two-component system response regulator n=1 Tax=Erysipelothrix larvae TaxID=1514105 RepID=A0A0X8H113_9FIRM|nr:response regulator [Erysipelothrix larvae]AMC94087.1 hypothetical protein AOC36_08825 [Erysipelothrix larvae]
MIRVLVVEDEKIARKGLIITTPWERWGLEVIAEASNGKEGLALANKLNPDIIMTDIRMPIMDGLDMIEALSQTGESIFIVMSAFSEFEYAKKALQYGAVDYLIKPFSDEQLNDALVKAVDNVKALQTLKRQQTVTRNDMLNTMDRYLSKSKRSQHLKIIAALDYIHEHYAKEVSISNCCDILDVSESSLSRLFRSETSFSFHEYLTIYRIKIACELLLDPNLMIYEVAKCVGYRDQRYFSVVFKKYMGMTPNHYKEVYQ